MLNEDEYKVLDDFLYYSLPKALPYLNINLEDAEMTTIPKGFNTALKSTTEVVTICGLSMTTQMFKIIVQSCCNADTLTFLGGKITDEIPSDFEFDDGITFNIKFINFNSGESNGPIDSNTVGFEHYVSAAKKAGLPGKSHISNLTLKLL